jgi:DNA-binding SARP family transcriptional activator
VEFRVLGPLEVVDAGRPVRLGGPQASTALAALLLAGGAVVAVGELIDALWDGEPPPTATHQVHKTIAGLRARLPGLIETVGTGYRLDADTDLARFTDLAATGTLPGLTAALALWRGPALAGIDSRALRSAAARLDDHRLAVLEASVELRLAAGDAAGLAVELPALVAANPLRETPRRQLMVALYRCGRQADALAVYAQTRALLADELGVDPGPDLARVHQQVLRADPALDRPGPAACTLPYDLPDFAGRTADLDRLLDPASTGAVVISAIDGMAGIGKTALAVHAAHRLAGRYPDGQLFCDLHAHTAGSPPLTPEAALERLLRMLGVPPEAIPEDLDGRAARWRAELAGRQVLVVLDNAADPAQVRPLLPGSPRSLVLVTSRRRLGVLEGATVLSLDVLAPAEARALFASVSGRAEDPAAAEVVELCGRLPLAIRIAATRLAHRPEWTVAELAARLRGPLAELSFGDRGVGPAFALSYQQLAPAERRLFRLLGRHPGTDFDAWSAAALAGTTPDRARTLLEALVDAHLLRPYGAGRYTFHDLLRSYAREVAPRGGAGRRLHDYFLVAATAATDLVSPGTRRFTPTPDEPPRQLPPLSDVDDALAWLAAEHHTLVAVALAAEDWQLACVLRAYFEHRGHFADWRSTSERALAFADPAGRVLLRFGLGSLAMWTGRLAEGMEHFRPVLTGADPEIEAAALTSLGMLAHLAGRDREATGYLRRALRHDTRVTALARNNLALAEARLGRGAAALSLHHEALATAGGAAATRAILLGLGETSLRLGLPAERPFREALELARAGRFRMQEALALDGLAHATGDPAWWREALSILTELGVDRAELVRRHLTDPGGRWCDLCRAPSTVDRARPVALLRR